MSYDYICLAAASNIPTTGFQRWQTKVQRLFWRKTSATVALEPGFDGPDTGEAAISSLPPFPCGIFQGLQDPGDQQAPVPLLSLLTQEENGKNTSTQKRPWRFLEVGLPSVCAWLIIKLSNCHNMKWILCLWFIHHHHYSLVDLSLFFVMWPWAMRSLM